MTKIAQNVHCILCDDVREEIGNKISLIGVYSDNISFEKFPALIPQLDFVFLVGELRSDVKSITLKLEMKGNKIPPLTAHKRKEKPGLTRLIFRIIPFRADDAGTLTAKLYANESSRPFFKISVNVVKGNSNTR